MATLPMIYAVEETADPALAARIVAPGKSAAEVRELLRTIRASGGVERARAKALAFHDDALAALDALPQRPEREALREIADFVVSRVR
jgi:octaprenyl-diphosphate synthase